MSTAVDDHYYWLTSQLAARGQRPRTSRAIAAMNAGLGITPLLLTASPAGPHGVVGRVLAVAIAVFAIGVATIWLSHAWPSRQASAISVTCSAIAVSAGCSIMANPAVGLFGTVSFVFATIHIALFHHPRLLLATWGIGGVTVIALAVRLAPIDPVLAFALAVMPVLVNAFVYFTCRQAIDLSATMDQRPDRRRDLSGCLYVFRFLGIPFFRLAKT